MMKGMWEGRIVWQTMHVQMSILNLQVHCKSFVYMILVFFHRFGVCEVYNGYAVACNDVINIGVDSVYITKSLGTQNDISTILNINLQNSFFVNHDEDCVDQVFRIICHYFLPPCGTVTNSLPPSSVCREECSQVQSSCQETWNLAKSTFGSDPFIDCEDTADLLSPIPNCCTGTGIEMSTKGEFSSPVSTHGKRLLYLYLTCLLKKEPM